MASIEFINNRILGKEKELEKLNKKLKRIRKVEAQGWQDPNPYYYSEVDLKHTLRDIEYTQEALDSYKKQLSIETEKAASRNVPVIIEFLNMWQARVTDFYKLKLEEFFAEDQFVSDLYKNVKNMRYYEPKDQDQLEYEAARDTLHKKRYGYYSTVEFTNHWGKKDTRRVKVKDGEYEWLVPYIDEDCIEDALVRLKKDLDQEWNRKYDFIIERTNHIVGQITDASNLTIGAKHDLNGFIKGTNGVAKVQTIDAGGHNIQCYHFRTLITEV